VVVCVWWWGGGGGGGVGGGGWGAPGNMLPPSSDFSLVALITERILPLPKIIRYILIKKFCPEELRQEAKQHISSQPGSVSPMFNYFKHCPRFSSGALKSPNFFVSETFNFYLNQPGPMFRPWGSLCQTMRRQWGSCPAVIY